MNKKAMKIKPDDVFVPSQDVVARKIDGEIIIIPLVAGVGDLEDDLYTLNETGQAIWERLVGEKSVRDIAGELGAEYQAPPETIMNDVIGIIAELARRRIIHKK